MVTKKHQGKVDLDGLLSREDKSSDELTPLFEAFTNSLEAILMKGLSKNEEYKIEIKFIFSGLFDTPEDRVLTQIELTDNGIGFDEDCYSRFDNIYDCSKNMNNKGSGRLQFLKSFKSVSVRSVFQENNKYYSREFEYSKEYIDTRFIYPIDNKKECAATSTFTKITFSTFLDNADKAIYEKKSLSDWKKILISHFLLKLSFIANPFIIKIIFSSQKNEEQLTITKKDIPLHDKELSIEIPYISGSIDSNGDIVWEESINKTEQLHIKRFKLPNDQLEKNEVAFYSKEIKVSNFNLPVLKKQSSIDGNRFITGIYGEILDKSENINQTRTKFTLPIRASIEDNLKKSGMPLGEKPLYIFFDVIEEKIKTKIHEIYPEIQKVKDEQESQIEELANAFYFSQDVVRSTKFELGDLSEEQILNKLYKTEIDKSAKQDAELHRIISSIKNLNPNEEGYQYKLEEKSREILAIIPEQNQRSLSKYIARRDIVVHLLEYILKKETKIQQQWRKDKAEGGKSHTSKEALIHNLIFKKKDSINTMNDLWFLNEEFVHFNGASDEKLTEISYGGKKLLRSGIKDEELSVKYQLKNQDESRPDILLFPEEDKIIIIEFKNEDVELTDHLQQIPKYAKLIANCISSDFKVKQFYGFLIGERLNDYAMGGEFTRAHSSTNGIWFDPNYPIKNVDTQDVIASLYYEVIKLSELHKRAFIRNKSFADRLGIRKYSDSDGIKIGSVKLTV